MNSIRVYLLTRIGQSICGTSCHLHGWIACYVHTADERAFSKLATLAFDDRQECTKSSTIHVGEIAKPSCPTGYSRKRHKAVNLNNVAISRVCSDVSCLQFQSKDTSCRARVVIHRSVRAISMLQLIKDPGLCSSICRCKLDKHK